MCVWVCLGVCIQCVCVCVCVSVCVCVTTDIYIFTLQDPSTLQHAHNTHMYTTHTHACNTHTHRLKDNILQADTSVPMLCYAGKAFTQ